MTANAAHGSAFPSPGTGTRSSDPSPRGRLIAFVGSEATGKSTIIDEMARWLGTRYRVRRIHAGKPPATRLTYVPHTLLPALRRLLPGQRSTHVERRLGRRDAADRETFPLVFGVRSVMLAYERRALIVRASAAAAEGEIVLCDRYPSSLSGAPDSRQLGHLAVRDPIRRWLAAIEARWYRDIPFPDLAVVLTAPLDVTLARNAARSKVEPEDHVRFRHGSSANLRFDGVKAAKVDTDRPLDEVVDDVRDAIAAILGR